MKYFPLKKKKRNDFPSLLVSFSLFYFFLAKSIYFYSTVMKDEIQKNVNDPLVDFLNIKDQAVDDVRKIFRIDLLFLLDKWR